MHCPISQHACTTPDCLTYGCALQRGVAYSQLQPAADEAQAADVQEAHSLKYHHCAQVFQLSSGKFALCGHFTNSDGMPLLAIGTWAELEEQVKGYRQLADSQAPTQHRAKPAKPTLDIAAYDNLFGDAE